MRPPGVVVTAVLSAVVVQMAAPADDETNCICSGSTSSNTTLVMVAPAATSTVKVKVRGQSGPVAVSFSGGKNFLASFHTVGVTVMFCTFAPVPTMGGSVAGLSSASAPSEKMGVTAIFTGVPMVALSGMATLMSMHCTGCGPVTEPKG